ncbi:MAG: lipopolysaccharide biosynthesis protein [Desulfobulbaceae bacterium]|nr:lipopolysaccharide biosynthesis protein [Desulfobulbaceae bacterium]
MTATKNNLSDKVVAGGTWLFGLRVSQKFLGIIRLLILARLLSPNDFGLLGISMAILFTLELFSTTGFDAALIHKKENIRTYLDSAWTVTFLKGFIIFLITFFCAPYLATFFNEPKLPPILQTIGFVILLRSSTNIGIVYFTKEFSFNKLYTYNLIGTALDFSVAVVCALIFRNVWALILGILAGEIAKLISSFVLHPYRPRFHIDIEKTKELFGYGKWVFMSNYLIFFLTQGKDLYVAKVLGTIPLGFYQLAYKISNLTSTEISQVIVQVTFPAYSKLQNDVERTNRSFFKVLIINSIMTFPISFFLITAAHEFITIFLSEKWLPIETAMQILCLHGLINSYNGIVGAIFQGTGSPKTITLGSALQLITLALLINPLSSRFGFTGTAMAITVSSLFIMTYLTAKLKNTIHCSFSDIYRAIILQIVSSGIMSVFIFYALRELPINIFTFVTVTVTSGFTYLITLYLLDKTFHFRILDTFTELIRQRFSKFQLIMKILDKL